MTTFADMADEELQRLAAPEVGNCVHDAHLGLNTKDCKRCNARRELWRRRDAQQGRHQP